MVFLASAQSDADATDRKFRDQQATLRQAADLRKNRNHELWVPVQPTEFWLDALAGALEAGPLAQAERGGLVW